MEDKKFSSFYDLEVYRNTSEAAVTVIQKILPRLPKEERFDLESQLRHSAKAVPRLIAEAYSKRFQIKGYQSLLDTATEESNESIVSLSQVRDIYGIEKELCSQLIDLYDKTSRQLQKLGFAWSKFVPRTTKADNPSAMNSTTLPKPIPKPNNL
jgi:four helix bundle protein